MHNILYDIHDVYKNFENVFLLVLLHRVQRGRPALAPPTAAPDGSQLFGGRYNEAHGYGPPPLTPMLPEADRDVAADAALRAAGTAATFSSTRRNSILPYRKLLGP